MFFFQLVCLDNQTVLVPCNKQPLLVKFNISVANVIRRYFGWKNPLILPWATAACAAVVVPVGPAELVVGPEDDVGVLLPPCAACCAAICSTSDCVIILTPSGLVHADSRVRAL